MRTGIGEREPLDFHSPYGCSKGAADQYVHDYARIYGLRTVVFRMSCIYGPRQFGNEDQGWVAHFMLAAAAGAPLTIYGNGKQVRDLLFVDDLVRAFKLAGVHIDRTAGHVYNIGGGPPTALSMWAELASAPRAAGRTQSACAHGGLAARRSAGLCQRHPASRARFRLDPAGRPGRRVCGGCGRGPNRWSARARAVDRVVVRDRCSYRSRAPTRCWPARQREAVAHAADHRCRRRRVGFLHVAGCASCAARRPAEVILLALGEPSAGQVDQAAAAGVQLIVEPTQARMDAARRARHAPNA